MNRGKCTKKKKKSLVLVRETNNNSGSEKRSYPKVSSSSDDGSVPSRPKSRLSVVAVSPSLTASPPRSNSSSESPSTTLPPLTTMSDSTRSGPPSELCSPRSTLVILPLTTSSVLSRASLLPQQAAVKASSAPPLSRLKSLVSPKQVSNPLPPSHHGSPTLSLPEFNHPPSSPLLKKPPSSPILRPQVFPRSCSDPKPDEFPETASVPSWLGPSGVLPKRIWMVPRERLTV